MRQNLSKAAKTNVEEAVAEAEQATGVSIWLVLNVASSGHPEQETATLFKRMSLIDPAVLVTLPMQLSYPVNAIGTTSVSASVDAFLHRSELQSVSVDSDSYSVAMRLIKTLRSCLLDSKRDAIDVRDPIAND